MENIKKRVSVFLVLVLCVNMLQLTAFAEGPEEPWDDVVTTSEDEEVPVAGTQTTQETTDTGSETDADTEIELADPELDPDEDVEWNEDWPDSISDDGEGPGPTPYDVPAVDSPITVELTRQEDGDFSGSTDVLDWDTFKTELEANYGIDLSKLEQEDGSSASSDDGNVTVSVSNDGSDVEVEIVQVEEREVTPTSTSIEDGTSVTLDPADFPDDATPIYADDGETPIGYEMSVTVPTGTGTATTKTTVTITKIEGQGSVIQTRTITTTKIKLSDPGVTVKGNVGEFNVTTGTESNEYGVTPSEGLGDDVTVDKVPVEDDGKLAVLAKYGYWDTGTEDDWEYDGTPISKQDAKDAMQAILFAEEGEIPGLNEDAQAFYDYLMEKIVAAGSTETSGAGVQALEGTMPEVQNAKVTINEGGETANVTLVVSLVSSVTGDLLVTLDTQGGDSQQIRLRPAEDGISDTYTSKYDAETGTYTFTIYNVKLNDEIVNLTITTSETVTERQVYQVNVEVPGTGPTETETSTTTKIEKGQAKADIESGKTTFDTSEFAEIYVKQSTWIGIFVSANDPRLEHEIIAAAKLKDPSLDGGKERTFVILKGDGAAELHKNGKTVVTVKDGILQVKGAISHVTLVDGYVIPGTPDATETYYGMTETTTTTTASATLRLDLTGGLPTATMTRSTQEQQRTGTAGLIQTTTREETETTNTWSNPGDDDDDDDVIIRNDDDDVVIPEPAVPLAETPETGVPAVEPPTEEIFDEAVPLAEIPEDEVPMTEIPDEMVPLADVPPTGDNSAIWFALAVLSAGGLLVLNLKKREDEEV